MSKYNITLVALFLSACAITLHAKPNVLLIMTDDQGWGDVNAHRNPHIDTPAMNRLAKQGASFGRFFVSPVCAPTRASLLTGRYHTRCNVAGVTRGWETMRTEELTLAEVFKANGYATGCFGKWHNGRHYPAHPNGQGFDTFVGFCGGHWNNYFDTMLERNGKPFKSKGYITDVITDEAIQFIERQTTKDNGKPWFCYVPYNAPHSPWLVPDKYWNKYHAMAKQHGWDNKATCAYAMVECIDDNIARLLNTLDKHQLAHDTIVLFLTDNGPNSARYNGNMRGRKGSVHEGGVRVPMFIRWPGHIPAGQSIKPIAAHIDILPTLVELCGVTKPEGPRIDGVSFKPLLVGYAKARTTWPDRKLFTLRYSARRGGNSKGAVRTQKWRATYEGKRWQLFDMENDPGQKKDVAAQHGPLVKQLAEAFETYKKDVGVGGISFIPIPVGHPKQSLTQLPANEAFLTPTNKGIWYSGHGNHGYANAWIKQWTDVKAFAHWEIDVMQSGKYELSMQYKVKKKNVGSAIRVSVGSNENKVKINATITRAHDPKPHPIRDRVAPSENYINWDWATMRLGTMQLTRGRSKLTLHAVEKAGDEIVDVKALWLRRVGP